MTSPADTRRRRVVTGRRSDAISLAVVALHYGVVFAPIPLAAWVGPGWETVVCWLWFGLSAQGALLALHESVHKLLFVDARLNEGLSRWLLAPLFLADFEAFRQRHWAHHRELGLAEDPKYTYRIDVRGSNFTKLVVSSLLLVQGLRRVDYQSGQQSASTGRSATQALSAIVLVQTGLVVVLVAIARAGHADSWTAALVSAGVAYGGVYLYGLASLGVLMHALRGIIEHRPSDRNEPRVHDAALRNFAEGPVQRWVFAPYGFDDHATHHRHPAVPYYALPDLTRTESRHDPTLRPVGSHLTVLRRLKRPTVSAEEVGSSDSRSARIR
jgi:fatty acid desaturase